METEEDVQQLAGYFIQRAGNGKQSTGAGPDAPVSEPLVEKKHISQCCRNFEILLYSVFLVPSARTRQKKVFHWLGL